MEIDLIAKALNAFKKGQNYCIATIVESTGKGTPRKPGAKMLVYEDGSLFGTIGGGAHEKEVKNECLKAIALNKTKLLFLDCSGKDKNSSLCGGKFTVFIDPVILPKQLIICGAGHIALPLSLTAKMLNYEVIIIDDRKEFANKKRFKHANKVIAGNQPKNLKKLKIDKNTYIMIVTHDHEHDFDCLKAVISSKAGYIGVIASKTKSMQFLDKLRKSGYSKSLLNKIDMPAGIDIGAQTPEEIAISIVAKLISEANYQFLGSEKFKK